jgi:elongation factor Ts
MANITAADVNKLRKMTGAGMMDCKVALTESEGDYEKAIEILRKKGQKVAAKRADREASEGIVIAKTTGDKNFGALVMVNSETDFVSRSEDFVKYSHAVLDVAINKRPKSMDELKGLNLNGRTVAENLLDLIGKTGEKLELGAYDFIEAPFVTAYNHHGNRLATLLGVNTKTIPEVEHIAHELAMQVAAMSPVAVDKGDVDPVTIEKEIEIGKEQARLEGKPENMLEKIALGKLNKFYKDSTLLNQDFVRDHTKTVRQYLDGYSKDLTVTGFRRQMLGN